MRKFIINIFCFLAILFLFCFSLSQIEFSDDFIVEKTKDTAYDKVGWNLNILKNQSDRIENSTIFLGSSYVLGGLNDSILSSNGYKALNFAVRHNGNDLSLYFLRRLALFNPKEIVFLKGKTSFTKLHKLAPLLIRPSTLIEDGQSVNLTFISYLSKRTKLALEYLTYRITSDSDSYNHIFSSNYGIVYDPKQMSKADFNSEETVNRLIKNQEQFSIYKNGYLFADEKSDNSFGNNFKVLKRKMIFNFYSQNNAITNFESQYNFIETAKDICENNKIIFSQLYVPVVSDVRAFGGYYGEFFRPNKSDSNIMSLPNYYFLNNYIYWADEHHLSRKGAEVYTKELLKNIPENLQ